MMRKRYGFCIGLAILLAAVPGFAADSAVGSVSVAIGNLKANLSLVNAASDPLVFPFGTSGKFATLNSRYYLAQTTVTNAQFVEVYNWAINAAKSSAGKTGLRVINDKLAKFGNLNLVYFDHAKIRFNEGRLSVEPGFENHPASTVTWFGAVMFCNWLTEMRDGNTDNVCYTGISSKSWGSAYLKPDTQKTGYRLPSTEEWEFAARYQGQNASNAVEKDGIYYTKADAASGASDSIKNGRATRAVAWYSCDLAMGEDDQLMPVAQKRPNTLGLYDMSGNIWQWTSTQLTCQFMMRGGSWSQATMPAAFSGSSKPDLPNEVRGFRIAMTF